MVFSEQPRAFTCYVCKRERHGIPRAYASPWANASAPAVPTKTPISMWDYPVCEDCTKPVEFTGIRYEIDWSKAREEAPDAHD